MKKVEFNKDVGTIKKGTVVSMESQMAARLITKKQAKLYVKTEKPEKPVVIKKKKTK